MDDASDFDVDPGICEGAILEELTRSVERGAVVYGGDSCVSSFAEHHSDTPSEHTNVVSAAPGWSKPCIVRRSLFSLVKGGTHYPKGSLFSDCEAGLPQLEAMSLDRSVWRAKVSSLT